MGILKSGFNNLIMDVSKGGVNLALDAVTRYHKTGDGLVMHAPAHENIIVYAAKVALMQRTFAQLNDLYPQYRRTKEMRNITNALDKYQGENRQKIISYQKNLMEQFEAAWNYRGKKSNDGVLLWIKNQTGEKVPISFNTYWDKVKNLSNARTNALAVSMSPEYGETTVKLPAEIALLDMTAIVQMNTRKNIVLTRVQGRDYSRKELISNGDLEFSVTGKIVSNFPDMYPTEEVSKLVKLMQHPGVVQVYGLMFQQMNVTQILVKDFRLTQQIGFKNEQPYSFSCVAVQPDKDVEVIEDTLDYINVQIEAKEKKSGWSKVLDYITNASVDKATQTLEVLTSKFI